MTRGKSICNVLKTIRKQLGKAVTIVGISAGMITLTGCAKDTELLVPQEQSEMKLGTCSRIIHEALVQMPSFPGGYEALLDYLSANVRYPEDCEETCVQGRVVVSFVVERDGSITKAKVAKSVYPSFDEEALRVVNAMPKWLPGKQSGKTVRTRMVIPISFKSLQTQD